MAAISIRQSGGAKIISIPKAIVASLGLETGDKLDLSIDNNSIILTPILPSTEENALQDLLDGSPKKCFNLTKEDQDWLNTKPIGKEI